MGLDVVGFRAWGFGVCQIELSASIEWGSGFRVVQGRSQ